MRSAIEASRPRRRAALVAAMLGFFVVAMDSQVVNVALPSIRTELGATPPSLQWVVTGYRLTFSTLLLFGGTASERIGARRAYAVGMVVFAARLAVRFGLRVHPA